MGTATITGGKSTRATFWQSPIMFLGNLKRRVAEHKLEAAAFIILILAASAVRLLTFDRYLPYNDHYDEPSMFLLARDWRGVDTITVIPEWLAGYPPLYVWINMGVQVALEHLSPKAWIPPADYYYVLRLLAALSGIATTAFVIWLGWEVGGLVAGWFAGLIWGLSPIVVEHNNFAIPDPLVYLTCAVSLCLSLRALHRNAPAWTSPGTVNSKRRSLNCRDGSVADRIPAWNSVTSVSDPRADP